MIMLTAVLVAWLVLTLPAAVLMGKCISRGMAPAPAPVAVPAQRAGSEDAAALTRSARSSS